MFARTTASRPSTEGQTIYAVGDIHGRLDLLQVLLAQIEADAASSTACGKSLLIFVGDYIDRGPASKGVIDRIIDTRRSRTFEVRCLMGNHERTLLDFLNDAAIGPIWATHGGIETLVDYGVSAPPIGAGSDAWAKARGAFEAQLPRRHLEFLSSLKSYTVCGDFLFVHAGVRHGVPLGEQTERDLLTIRQDFLTKKTPFEKVVVHGHTPVEAAYSGPHRINIDTGAYATGVLTAVRLLGDQRGFLRATAPTAPPKRKQTSAAFRARWGLPPT
jgi:serine/threonine protein phosphatase 1